MRKGSGAEDTYEIRSACTQNPSDEVARLTLYYQCMYFQGCMEGEGSCLVRLGFEGVGAGATTSGNSASKVGGFRGRQVADASNSTIDSVACHGNG